MNPHQSPQTSNENSRDSTQKQSEVLNPKSFSEKEKTLYQKVFSPNIKRKPYNTRSTRKTCEEVVNDFYPETEVSYEALRMKLITSYGRCSRPTILSYLGRPETRQKNTVEHTVNYLKSGATTNKQHIFINKYPAKRGYLEIFGLAALHTDRKPGKIWFRLFHTEQTKIDSVPLPPQRESLKESDTGVSAEFKEALKYAKQQIATKQNFSLVNSVSVANDKKPVLQANVNTSVRDGDRERVVNTKKIFEVSGSNLSKEEKRLFSLYDSVTEASR